MQRLAQVIAGLGAVVLILLITGVIDETYIVIFLTLVGMPVDVTAETLQKALDAFAISDWRGVGAISAPLLKAGLLVYFVRSLIYVAVVFLILRWSFPYLQSAYVSLRTTDPKIDSAALSGSDTEVRTSVVSVLRVRASRKRVESYAFLTAALVSLAIAVGFVTRDFQRQQPDSLEFGSTSTFDALAKSEAVLREARSEETIRRSEQERHENELLDLVRQSLAAPSDVQSAEHAKSNHALLTALVNRDTKRAADQTSEASVSREYIQFARAQLDVASRQAELEVIQTTAITVVIKIAALALILALAHALVRLYDRGLNLSLQYDGIADSLILAPKSLTLDLEQLRRVITPVDAPNSAARLPRSVLDAVDNLVAEVKKRLPSKGTQADA